MDSLQGLYYEFRCGVYLRIVFSMVAKVFFHINYKIHWVIKVEVTTQGLMC